jgi:hypothetical protein
MGLDISHDAWHGAYAAFNRWRCEIARVAKLPPLMLMEGFWRGDWVIESYKKKNPESLLVPDWYDDLPIRWEGLRPDDLIVLLDHSDCEGEISAENAIKIADRLEQLLPLLPTEPDGGHIGDWRKKTQEFIDGCRLAASLGEPLVFG